MDGHIGKAVRAVGLRTTGSNSAQCQAVHWTALLNDFGYNAANVKFEKCGGIVTKRWIHIGQQLSIQYGKGFWPSGVIGTNVDAMSPTAAASAPPANWRMPKLLRK